MSDDWKEDLFAQKSLWEVYWISARTIDKRTSNRVVFWCAVGILISFAAVLVMSDFATIGPSRVAAWIFKVADISLPFATGILGFLIAGFAIFAGLTEKETFIELAKRNYEKEGAATTFEEETNSDEGVKTGAKISLLQYIFFNFLNVFSVYLLLSVASLIILVVFTADGPGQILTDYVYEVAPCFILILNISVLVGLGVCLVSSLLRLKAFIWSLYQTVIFVIVVHDEINGDAADE